MPRVSVCMCVFNGEATIRDALQSVLAQSYRDYDIWVVDDGSKDRSAEIAEEMGANVVRQPNGGTGAARKNLIEHATGEYVAFLDHDDEWATPDKLEKQIRLLDETGAVMTHSDCWFEYEDNRTVERNLDLRKAQRSWDHVLPDNQVINSSAVFRRQPMLDAGNYRPENYRCSDWYGWLVLAPHGDFVHLPEKQVRYRVLSTSLANAGFRFQQAKRLLLKDIIRPQVDQLFQDLPAAAKQEYVGMIDRNIGVAASTMAKYLDAEGKKEEAKELHKEALKLAAGVPRVWTRALKAKMGLR